jgi:RNA polymerase sigma factor (sigma-70 family)
MNNEQEYLERRVLLNQLYDHYKPLLTEKQREVYELHEFSDLSLSEIAEIYGKSRQAVHDLLYRTRSKLEMLEEKLGLVTREENENV